MNSTMRNLRRLVVLVIGCMILVSGTAAADPQADTAASVQRLHDRLAAGHEAGDVTAVSAAVAELRSTLGALSGQDAAMASRSEVTATAVEADRLNSELAVELAALPTVEQKILPPLPGPLGALSALLNSLLGMLLALVASLLGGGLPVPLPVPVPELPVPSPAP